MADLGLFPLDLVLMPGERVPLHIFEPRYRELIGECLDTLGEFGLIYDGGDGLSPVGTRARVDEVLQRFGDGRFNVVVEGTTRFRLVAETSGRSYRTAEVGDVDDTGESPTPVEVAACLAAYVEMQAGGEAPDPDGAPAGLAFSLAAGAGLPNDLKQRLLELRSERARVLLLTEALSGEVGAGRRAEEIERRASSNGRIDHF